ncbi:glycosyltransferase family 4 protein [Thiopseudomonas alkaliphila]|uniref:glycosyltransferase family 4 protein n=1 Tax=Thiopseudomonas alkaliphila TaxID=1697053 RepID=UPI002574912E|nr:glycosyltransferase family 4 protein [Thiopseudomonas alkaliphila]MDM1706952.1 glycosyltransferase family 4 protein [Thiopseudomonas alkaliphila]
MGNYSEEKNNKSFLLVNSTFYPSAGGVETTIRGMAESLSSDGHNVVIVSGDKTNIDEKRQAAQDSIFGAQVYRYKTLPFFLYYITCTLLLLKIKKANNFDLVISRSIPTTLCLLMAGYRNIKYIAPAVYAEQNHPEFFSARKVVRYISYLINSTIERLCICLLSEVYVFSSEMKEQIKKIDSLVEVKEIFPGVDKKRFHSVNDLYKKHLREKHGLPVDKKILLFIGRVELVKNPIDTIKVLKYLPDNYITVVVGNGRIQQDLVGYVNDELLAHRVFFVGFTSKPEEFFQLADAFLMTSVYEPFGQVILEAMSCNTNVFGYFSDSKVRTATTEIFDRLGVVKEDYLVLSESGVQALASKIENNISSKSTFNDLIYGWSDLVYGLDV